MFNTEMLQWLKDNGLSGLMILMLFTGLVVLYHWLKRAEPISLIRSWINRENQRLETMLTLDYLPAITHARIRLELRQRAHIQLTGLSDPRLAEAAVIFTTRNRLRGRYLRPWRSWLRESSGHIEFDAKLYRDNWLVFSCIFFPLSVLVLGLITWAIALRYGTAVVFPAFLFNGIIWWLPGIYFLAVPFPPVTRTMAARLEKYNSQRHERDSLRTPAL